MQTYDPNDVVLSVLGSVITQYAKGTFIEVDYDANFVDDEVGAQGDVVRVINQDKRGTIKITLMKASPSNDYLTGLATTDRQTAQAVGPSLLKDIGGTSIAGASESWVRKVPANKFATESSTAEWEIRCAELASTVGQTIDK